MTTTRERVRRYVERHPGVHLADLQRALDIATGQAQYHVRELRRDGALAREQIHGQTHLYPPAVDPAEREALALARRETSRDVLVDLLEHGPARPPAVAERVGIARSTLAWHVDRLVDGDLVRKQRDERGRVTLAVADAERVGQALRTVRPSLPGRLVDRFERLVDDALGE